jgi:hypothetical protein
MDILRCAFAAVCVAAASDLLAFALTHIAQ